MDFGFWIEEDFGLKGILDRRFQNKKGTRPFDRMPSLGEDCFRLLTEDRA